MIVNLLLDHFETETYHNRAQRRMYDNEQHTSKAKN